MLIHVLLFLPRPTLSAADRERVATALSAAIREIPTVRGARVGRRVTHGRPYEQLMTVDYEYAAILEFDTAADLTAYLAHSAHDDLGALFFEAFDVALMYDYEMQSGAAGVAALL